MCTCKKELTECRDTDDCGIANLIECFPKYHEQQQQRIAVLEQALYDTFQEYNRTGHLSTKSCIKTGLLLENFEPNSQ